MTLTKCEAGIEGLGENGVVVTFDQSPKRILADLDGLAFDTAAARVVDSLPRRGSDRR